MKKIAVLALVSLVILGLEFLISLGYEIFVERFGWSAWVSMLKMFLRLLSIPLPINAARKIFKNKDDG